MDELDFFGEVKMRVYIMGIDGYIGWPLANYLIRNGHEVAGCDSLLKRRVTAETQSGSCTPVEDPALRAEKFRRGDVQYFDAGNYQLLKSHIERVNPDVVVNLAQIPSAPYSMGSWATCSTTQENNNRTNLSILWVLKDAPHLHLVTLGTMGEWGTPGVDIPEGEFDLEFRGRSTRAQFPRKPGSFYHASKVHSSTNCEFACRSWGVRITDIMQGVVYGVRVPTTDCISSFHVDECWGTAINRFVAQGVVGHPITVYGSGTQKRGFLPLRDSIRCIEMLCNREPALGEYNVVNQFDQAYTILELAEKVQASFERLKLPVPEIVHVQNPRVEQEDHYYNPDRKKLLELGYQPSGDVDTAIEQLIVDVLPYKPQIAARRELMLPKTSWCDTLGT